MLIAIAGLVASPVMADTGLPMLALLWPGFILLLLPIVLIEAAWAKKRLGLEWKPAISLATRANAISTFAGVPLAWVGMFCIEMVLPSVLTGLGIVSRNPSDDPPYVAHMLYTTVMAAWIPDGPEWYLPAASATLLVPCYFVSAFIEARSARKSQPGLTRSQAKAWSWQANLLTYIPLFAGLALAAIWVAVSQQ